ncbi:MAG: hypothetical protein IPH13_09470 [Planctomycetes bacterium]|nr:hypothetical protein [Planctomycetota bacterium]
MKSLLLASSLAAVAGGAVGGFVVTGSAPATHEIAAAGPDDVVELKALADVLRTNEDLRVRLDVLESRPFANTTPERVATADIDAPSKQLEPELRELVSSLRDPDAPLPDTFRQEIASVIADVKAKEEKAREEERAKRDQERFEQRMTQITTELKLTPYQSNEMRKTLTAEEKKRDELRAKMFDGGGDFQSMRETFDKLRTDTKTELAKYLTNEQITTYDEKFGNTFGRGGRGPGGFGGFGRGPGGGGGQTGGNNQNN